IQSFVGTRYDAGVVSAFVEACREGQIRPGSVKLKSRAAPETKIMATPVETILEREPIPVS
ncbi:MAG: hypothetical protein LC775_08130, partial [Acidobacteria bacterium]|nr:hypothetical protein [Acidobacteriota bacterium]